MRIEKINCNSHLTWIRHFISSGILLAYAVSFIINITYSFKEKLKKLQNLQNCMILLKLKKGCIITCEIEVLKL